MAHLAKRFPQHIRQKTDEDVSKDSVFRLVPDGANLQVALVDSEGGFRLGQLNVGLPQFFISPAGDVGS